MENNKNNSNNSSNNDTPPYYYYDTVVIGGGLGGLTAGAMLAKQPNQSVLLLEQHYVPGGCATTFKRHDYLLEVGLHEMDGLGNKDDPKNAIFDHLGVSDQVEFLKVPEFFCVPNIINSRNGNNGGNSTRLEDDDDDDDDDSTGQGQHYSSGISKTTAGACAATTPAAMAVMPHGNDECLKMVAQYYPDDLDGATRFVRLGEQLQNEIRRMPPKSAWIKWLLIYPFMPFLFPATVEVSRHTVGSWCDKYLTTNEFKLLFTANVLYYSDDPYNLSMMHFVMAQSSFISGGGYFIKGGSQRLSDCLASVITSASTSTTTPTPSTTTQSASNPRGGGGGTVLLGKTVKEILVDDESGRAIGVKIVDSYNTQSPELVVYCKSIVCNACPQIIQRILPDPYRSKISSSIDELKPSCSLITIYLGFDQEPKTLGVRHYSTFIASSSVKTMKDVGPTNKGPCWYTKPIMFVDYSQLAENTELAPRGKSVGALCSVDYVSNWDDLSLPDYKKQKDRVTKILLDRLIATYPNLDGHIEYFEAGTAKTIQRYTLNQAGSVYGYDQNLQQSGMNRLTTSAAVSTGIQNMYFGSAWSFPGGGFTGAILSGFFASRAVMADVDTAAKKQDGARGWTSFLPFPSFSFSQVPISPESSAEEITTPPRSFRDLQFLQYRTVEDDRVVPLVSKRFVARDTIELTFHRPANLNKYQPGQYCVVRLNNPKLTELDLPLRPLSILSHPKPSQSFGGGGHVDDDVIKFTMRTASQTSYKRSCEEMEVGDTVTLYGPMGDFGRDIFVKDPRDDDDEVRGIVFLVAGIGITPVLPILQELFRVGSCQEGWNRSVYLFYSNRYTDQAAYHNQLQTMAAESNAAARGGWNFKYVPVTTSTQARISIDTLTAKLNNDLTQFDYYIVGATPFLLSMESILTLQGRVPASQINSDDFG